ncbi:hypothetical protein [Pseudonocardia kunmingensis]|uniref:Rhodanese domain-containing protein n=1 Tax=Pseudonocardia kunmingensis TaxID=630975 RepID=A0A543DIN6_9PSEU|nr:hypothetical protein [Pseudonocardia kunmingensis]TQM09171.1 hypothetical protein FB558_4921 [Pseudonocardia kunmingensis]
MRLYAGEPVAGPWRAVRVAQVLDLLGRPRVLAWAEWQAAEDPFQAVNRPWERAGLVVSGAPQVPHDPHRELVVAHRWA